MARTMVDPRQPAVFLHLLCFYLRLDATRGGSGAGVVEYNDRNRYPGLTPRTEGGHQALLLHEASTVKALALRSTPAGRIAGAVCERTFGKSAHLSSTASQRYATFSFSFRGLSIDYSQVHLITCWSRMSSRIIPDAKSTIGSPELKSMV